MLARQIKATLFVTVVFLSLLLGLSLLSGCKETESTGSVTVWLDVPLDGLLFSELRDLNIKGHAEAKDTVSSVEIWVNGALLTTISKPPTEAGLAGFNTKWTPDSPGEYTIQAIAFGADGTSSQPDSVRVTFGEESAESQDEPAVAEKPEPEDVPPAASEPPASETPQTEPKATIQFWADPPVIAAGDCTTIRWQVENAGRVIFGGADQPLSGSYRDCLCAAQTYSLRVFNLDGTEERRTLEVRVTGSCETPQPPPPSEPPPDTTPPPAPTP
ncbi:MAG: Ig-like domain-containing protein, partial [Dethiobacteria bacterium]|nr:Ig-like domain-containing protein [Dethiobacteria bacterium]